jgi:glycosyltransferase involved in cell wall biosynthesis
VPTVYREPKGLYVLEALANGVPVVQPEHGAFPELLAGGGGILFPPGDVVGLAKALAALLTTPEGRIPFATIGQAHVREFYNDTALARETLRIFANHL